MVIKVRWIGTSTDGKPVIANHDYIVLSPGGTGVGTVIWDDIGQQPFGAWQLYDTSNWQIVSIKIPGETELVV